MEAKCGVRAFGGGRCGVGIEVVLTCAVMVVEGGRNSMGQVGGRLHSRWFP